jgi:hypothetical protein
MAWEQRKGRDGRYYTRSRRVGGRMRREYIGTGPVAEAIAQVDAFLRVERKREVAARKAERAARDARYRELFGPLDVLDAACAAAVRREMEAAGYHLHKREWRKRRNAED